MSTPTLAIDGASVVLLGAFDPTKATPGFLAADGLISKDVALAAVTPFIAPNLTAFDAAWLHCEATEGRLMFSTGEPAEFQTLRDLAIAFLNTHDDSTKVAVVAINRSAHFAVASRAEWHRIGDNLIPKDPWKGLLNVPGTRAAIIQGIRPDDFAGHVQVTVEPSFRLPAGSVGIYIEHNDQYNLRRVETQPTNRDQFLSPEEFQGLIPEASSELIPLAREVLATKWSDSMAHSEKVIQTIWQMRK